MKIKNQKDKKGTVLNPALLNVGGKKKQEGEALKDFRESLAPKNPAVRPSWAVGT